VPGPSASTRLQAARRFTRALATSHYENFSIATVFLPRPLHQHFYNIYAYCRHSDDLADEISDTSESLRALRRWRSDLLSLYGGPSPDSARAAHSAPAGLHPILVALADTIERFDIPPTPFLKLIDAFEQDRRVNRYQTYAQVLDYCARSADPVGHLVLYLCGYRDPRRQRLADFTCTALQLTNFWQDVRRDFDERNRIYLPREDMERFGVCEADIADGRVTPACRELIRFEVDRAQELFDRGKELLRLLSPRVRTDIGLFIAGGEAILRRIRARNYDTLTSRPALNAPGKLALLLKAGLAKMVQG
jgi:squalene synthase HpnC